MPRIWRHGQKRMKTERNLATLAHECRTWLGKANEMLIGTSSKEQSQREVASQVDCRKQIWEAKRRALSTALDQDAS